MNWPIVPMEAVMSGFFDGPHATPGPCDEGPVFLGIKNLTDDGHLDLSDIRHISEAEFPRWTKRVTPAAGDIVFTYEATLNRYAIVPPGFRGCLGRRMALIRPNSDRVDTRFLHYSFFSPEWRQTIAKHTVTGSTVDRIPLKRFPTFPLRLPPLPTQRRIAGILSAYDDLIENNTKRIKILEEMARALYREWFVHFRFPGHENVKLVDSPVGQIPEGWEASSIGSETTKIGSGATPKGGKGAYKTEGITLIRSLNVYDYRFEDKGLAFIDEAQAGKLDNVVVEAQDVLLNITGASVARCCMARTRHLPARVNQHVAIIRANMERIDPYYLLCTINNDEQERQLLAYAQGGATREALTKGTIQKFPLIVPEVGVVRKFGEVAGAFLRQREVLEDMNGGLRATRDLLLPRLLSGDTDVDALDLPEAAQ